MWVGIGHGMKGGAFWGLRRLPPLKWDLTYAAIDNNFLPLDVGVELIRLNNQTRLLSETMAGALPPMDDVAIYFPHETFNQKFLFKDDFPWSVELNGIFEMLDRAGYSVRFISDENIREIADYPVVVMPYAPMVPQPTQQALAEYAENGGRLVAFGAPAKVDHLNNVYASWPAQPLAEIFGTTVAAQGTRAGYLLSERLPLLRVPENIDLDIETVGMRISTEAKDFVQGKSYDPLSFDLRPASARVVATWNEGSPAITENATGSGSAVLIGFLPGTIYFAADAVKRSAMEGWIQSLLGTDPTLRSHNPAVLSSVLKNGHGSFVFVVNNADQAQHSIVSLNPDKFPSAKRGDYYDLLQQTRGIVEGGHLTTTLEPAQAAVFFFPTP
jgi:hypothetical protein